MPDIPFRIRVTLPNTTESHFGTVLYSGPVPPTKGDWLGVEWDDPTRGKHDGVHDATGIRYFTCRVPGAGSFLRPHAPGLSFGVSFPEAIQSKYAPVDLNAQDEEKSTFYATESNFEIEVTSLAKIDSAFRNLGRLREIGLEGWDVAFSGAQKERDLLTRQLINLEILNLSFSLIPSLVTVSDTIDGLKKLKTLLLNSNRFSALTASVDYPPLHQLTELQLNKTLFSWTEIIALAPSLPSLTHLQVGSNGIKNLPSFIDYYSRSFTPFPMLEILNLAENELSDWEQVSLALNPLPKLSRLILSSNKLVAIKADPDSTPTSTLRSLRHLSLSDNPISTWASIDSINNKATFPRLDSIAVSNCLFCGDQLADIDVGKVRSEVIARIGGLLELDGSIVKSGEREDSELFYLSQIGHQLETALTLEQRDKIRARNPRWKELTALYGRGDGEKATETVTVVRRDTGTIKSKLIKLQVSIPSHRSDDISVSILPSQPTRILRTLVAKALGTKPLLKNKWLLEAVLKPREGGEDSPVISIPAEDEGREISWWGLEEGDKVMVVER
ncbi:RNI-like protein [Meredithblackwellia eburnea MCA 4105]